MHAFLECKVLGSCQCYLRSDQTLYNRVVCQVQEHNNVVRYTAFLQGPAEELCYVVFNTHSGKYDCKLLIRISKGCLLYDLCCQLVVRKSVSGEDRQLLSTNQGGQTVDCRNTGMDIVSGYLRVTGFSGRPLTFLLYLLRQFHSMRSIGFPIPSKVRPRISRKVRSPSDVRSDGYGYW